MAFVNVPVNSLIIPMDTTYQNRGMFHAYGLVYHLLQNGIPVMWSIAPGKPYNGTDFVASATDLDTSATIHDHAYSGGPFIIDAGHAAAAVPLIGTWQAANTTSVHRVDLAFDAPVFATLTQPLRIAVAAIYASSVTAYLNAAGIPDSTGKPWPKESPDILSLEQLGSGALFVPGTAARRYGLLLAPAAGTSAWQNAEAMTQLDAFVRQGGHLFALGQSIGALENQLMLLTTGGIPVFGNRGNPGTFTVDLPGYGLGQAAPTNDEQVLPAPNPLLPWPSALSWRESQPGLAYYPATRVAAHFLTDDTEPYDLMITGPYKGGQGAGMVTYAGGSRYSVEKTCTCPGMENSYLNNREGPYVRFLLNGVLLPAAQPQMTVTVAPENAPIGKKENFTVTITNSGGADAEALHLTVTPAEEIILTGSSLPPTTAGPPTWAWEIPAAPQGDVLTVSLSGTLATEGQPLLAPVTAAYRTPDGLPITLGTGASCCCCPAPIPFIRKQPLSQTGHLNQEISWSIDTANNGTATLYSPVITDTLPAGLTFVSATPTPSSVTEGPGGTTIVTWQSPAITTALQPGPGPQLTLTVRPAPAASAHYTNVVTLSGTDLFGKRFTDVATAELAIINRPPEVTITNPQAGQTICGIVPVTWTAFDPDGDPLTYSFAYSLDCGTTWTVVATGLTATTFNWDTDGLTGTCVFIRVVASDGHLTGEDIVGPLSLCEGPPTVAIIAPPEGSVLCDTVMLVANAASPVGIHQVSFAYSLDNGATWVPIGVATEGPPFAVSFDTSGIPAGPILVRAVALDNAGRTATAFAHYGVDHSPIVAIIAPPNGATVKGTVTVVGSATGNVRRVEWFIDNNLVLTQTAPPFELVWDTTQFTEGPHTITLKAFSDCPNPGVASATYIVANHGTHTGEVGIEQFCVIPLAKPEAERLLEHNVRVKTERVHVIDTPDGGKVIVTGHLYVIVKYVAAAPTQSVHAVECRLPWTTYIPAPELTADTPVKVTTLLEHVDLRLVDPHTIAQFIVLLVGAEPR